MERLVWAWAAAMGYVLVGAICLGIFGADKPWAVLIGLIPLALFHWTLRRSSSADEDPNRLHIGWLDRQAIREAEFTWPRTRSDLDEGYVNHVALKRQWDNASSRGITTGDIAALAWREPRLVGLADIIATEIRDSRAWQSELFDVHRARIDLDGALADINCRAYRIWLAHANTVRPRGEGDVAQVLSDHRKGLESASRAAWVTLVDRVLTLAEYRHELAPLDAMLSDLDLLTATVTNDTDALTRQLYIDAAVNEIESQQIDARTRELQELRANLAGRMKFLRDQITSEGYVLPVLTA